MEKPSTIKKLRNFLVMTSSVLLDTFLSDDADKRLAKANLQEMRDTLQHAADEKSLVVLQLDSEHNEVVSGWIVGKNIGKEQIVIKIQENQQQMRIVDLKSIIKVSTLSPEGKNMRAAR